MDTEKKLAQTVSVPLAFNEATINGYSIRYVVAGEGEPILLIHGANFGWGIWYPNIPALAKTHRVYALDLPGAGRSTRVPYHRLEAERDLSDVVRQFIVAQNLSELTIVGCSIGGWLAMKMALLLPDRVQRVVVENSVGFADYMSFNEKVIGFYPLASLIANTALRPRRDNPRIEAFLRSIFFDKQLPIRPEFIDYFYETMATSHNLLFISRLTALAKEWILTPFLPQVKQPVLIVWGKEDTLMPLAKNQPFFSRLPHAQQVILEQTGHIPSFERPEGFNEAVLTFMWGNPQHL